MSAPMQTSEQIRRGLGYIRLRYGAEAPQPIRDRYDGGARFGAAARQDLNREAAMPDEYVLRLEASGEVTPAQPDDDTPEPEEGEQ